MEEFDFLGPDDKPALLAITNPQVLAATKATLNGMGYKTHVVDSHFQFETRYLQVNYLVVMIEETFAGANLLEHPTLQFIQGLPMAQRRYAVFFLLSPALQSLDTMQAFAQSVHCIVNFSDLPRLGEVVQKTMAENDLFLTTFRDVQRRVYQKGS